MTTQDNGLFLLEALVDKITFQESCLIEDNIKTFISIECAPMPRLEICESHGDSCDSHNALVRYFNSGKSCLFSLKEEEIHKSVNRFEVQVTVSKLLQCGSPTTVPIGSAIINMTKEFVQTQNDYFRDPNSASYKALKDTFNLTGPDGLHAGNIDIFLRISFFGNLIVTSFKGLASPTSNKSASSLVVNQTRHNAYPKIRNTQLCMLAHNAEKTNKDSSAQSPTASKKQPCTTEGGKGICPPAKDAYNSKPCEDPDDPCYCSGPKQRTSQKMACRNVDQYCLHVPKGRNKQFEEIGMNLGGNELKIKVPANASIIKKISQTHCTLQRPYTKGTDTSPCDAPCGRNQISLALPSEATCCQGAQPAGTQFTCTTEGCTQASKHGQQAARGDNMDLTLQNRDVFVLKVAKTAMQGDKKCKLEVELVTPKGPEKKQPIKKKNTRMQSDCDCECCIRRLKRTVKKKLNS